MSKRRLSKTKRNRQLREQENILNKNLNTLRYIKPLTTNQSKMFDLYDEGKNIIAAGSVGTGKTFLALYLAYQDVLKQNTPYEQVVIFRSSVQSRNQGYQPGNSKEKMSEFEQVYVDLTNELFDSKEAYGNLKRNHIVDFKSTSFNRGITLHNTIIVVDEIQNMNYQELRTVFTRQGNNSRIILCGDTKQNDLEYSTNRADVSGLGKFIEVTNRMDTNCIGIVNFNRDDIVRSEIVKNFIIAEEEMEAA